MGKRKVVVDEKLAESSRIESTSEESSSEDVCYSQIVCS